MTAKNRIDKLSKVIKPKQDQGQKVKVKVPINSIFEIGEPDQVVMMRESQIEEMDRILDLVYGEKKEE
jgi:hypothetical protein